MSKKFYLPGGDTERVRWLNNFSAKLPGYSDTLGITDEELDSVKKDAAVFAYVVQLVEASKREKQERTAYKNLLRNGPEGVQLNRIVAPGQPAPAPEPVPPGIFVRTGRLVNRIKNHPSYNESIGQDLGIIGAETVEDDIALQPSLKISLKAGYPVISWKKGASDGIQLYVDRMDGKGFVFLATDMRSPYVDKARLPDGVESARWEYKAIYIQDDESIGKFSDVASVTVGAVPKVE